MKLRGVFLIILLLTCTSTFGFNWQQKASFGGVGRHRAIGISIANKGYIGLGHVNGTGIDISYKDWWQYDPASDSWTQKADYPTFNHGAIAFSANNKGYVGGGSYLNGEFYCFDPLTNTWTPIAPCPVSPGDVQAFSVQDKGYVYYGYQLFEYNPTTNSWSEKAPCPINLYSWSNSFSTYSSGYVKTGSFLYEYKPSANEWIQRASFPGLMSNGGSAFSLNQKGYFTCGYVSSLSDVTNQVWEYNPGNDIWTLVNEFPGNKRRFSVAFSINNKGYFGTGTNGTNFNDFWQFDLKTLNLEENNLEHFSVSNYPNPVKENVNFKINGYDITSKNKLTFSLFTSDGRKITEFEIQSTDFSIERKEVPNGIYFYSVFDSNTIKHTGKLIYY